MPIDVIDYSNTVFYKIYCKDPAVKDLYVGHTTNFVQRKYNHKRTCIKENDANHHLKVYKFIREHGGWDNWKMEIIGFKDCYDHYEARKVEQKYFETLQATLNSIEPLPKPKPRPTQINETATEKQVWYCDVCQTLCETKKALIDHEETNKHKHNANRQQINEMETNETDKNESFFLCKKCNFKCCYESDFNRHLLTKKHKMETNENKQYKTEYVCCCGKIYSSRAGLWKHKKGCSLINKSENETIVKYDNKKDNSNILDIILQNKEIMDALVLQNEQLMKHNTELTNTIKEIVPKVGDVNSLRNVWLSSEI